MGTSSAILHFNDGTNGILQVLDYCNRRGKIPHEKSLFANANRIKQMKRKSSKELEGGGKGRKKLRSIKKGFTDNEKERVEAYVAGGF